MPQNPPLEPFGERRLIERLVAALAAAGWSTSTEVTVGAGPTHQVDVIARKGSLTYVIEVKTAREGRSAQLTSLAAAGLLQARRYASLTHGTPMVVVGAPRLSPALVRDIGQFLAEFGDGAPWGVVDGRGLVALHGPGLEDVTAPDEAPAAPRHDDPHALAARGAADPFTDLGQWCLKVLLSHRLPIEWQLSSGGVRLGRPVRHAAELARLAEVSTPTAWRSITALQERGLLAATGTLRPLRTDALMQAWRAALARPGPELRARWLFPSSTAGLARLRNELVRVVGSTGPAARPPPRMAVGLFGAAELRGHGFVRGVAPHLLHEDPSPQALEELGLIATSPGGRVDVFVRKPRFPASVFRGVEFIDGAPVVDLFQIWLDVSEHPARGGEMAEHLARGPLSGLFRPESEGLIDQTDFP